ncbi:Hint domain-containing protein [Pseudobacteriovorax antillogorgiicola]|uniref:Intein N-terminal splicing region n=1 Tax=Pseudobacteriovorax antillogorgiicola TaxID=1513793 RepID=A0A1Y6CKD8_9BACT|nr:Hint domain-containing protein [Pseudobacteriovorax antillogorgiicola]TCS45870.1 intein [Pseudobacteriovorax antillogorgiicola]SMF71291.1 intein N-terminal splicing region [Pseudobacteriovorax antillogorgiicola]
MTSERKFKAGVVLLASAISGMGFAGQKKPLLGGSTGAIVEARCPGNEAGEEREKDWLNFDQAQKRVEWALNCGHIEKSANRLFTHYLDEDTWAWVPFPNGKMAYPTFGENKPNDGFPVWIPNLSSCNKPENVFWLAICRTGCYTKNQVVLFQDGYSNIEDAIAGDYSSVITLTPDATFESLEYENRNISYFTKDRYDAEHPVIHFETESGNDITVTTEHPLVDEKGFIKFAFELKEGDYLVRDTGEKDKIVSVENKSYFGRVYNVAPKGHAAESNVVVAQGFLNGSARYQDGTIRDYNRTLGRSIIEPNLLD